MPIQINGSGTITGISAGGLPDNCITAADLATTLDLSSNTVTLPSGTGGKILQIVQAEKTDTFSFSASSGVYNTVFSASITPASTANKILIMWSSNASAATGQRTGFRILRDGTATVGIGDAAGSRVRSGQGGFNTSSSTTEQNAVSQVVLDSPSTTSSVTYALQCCCETSGGTTYVNRSQGDSDANSVYRSASHIILMEVAG